MWNGIDASVSEVVVHWLNLGKHSHYCDTHIIGNKTDRNTHKFKKKKHTLKTGDVWRFKQATMKKPKNELCVISSIPARFEPLFFVCPVYHIRGNVYV